MSMMRKKTETEFFSRAGFLIIFSVSLDEKEFEGKHSNSQPGSGHRTGEVIRVGCRFNLCGVREIPNGNAG